MKIFTGLIILCTLLGFLITPRKRFKWMNWLPLFGLVSLLFTIIIENLSWQMIPLSLLILIIFFITIRITLNQLGVLKTELKRIKNSYRIFGSVLGLIILLLAIIPLILFPVFTLPETTGPFPVGTRYLQLKDGQSEHYLQVWYPAESRSKKLKPYWHNAKIKSRLLGQLNHTPPFLLNHLGLVKTNSTYNAEFKESIHSYPVLIYSPGYRMLIDQNSILLEDLASYGYVVFGVSHPIDTPFIDIDHQNLKIFNSNPQIEKELDEKLIKETMAKLNQADSQAEGLKIYHALIERFPETINHLKARCDDIVGLLDRLSDINFKEGFFKNKLDIKKVGILGMSLGGATAVLTCLKDKRCRVGVNIDGLILGDIFETKVTFPSLLITSEQTALRNKSGIFDPFDKVFASYSSAYCGQMRIRNTSHMNLTDWSLFGPFLKLMGVLGEVNGSDCLRTQNYYIQLFFDKHLRKIETPGLNQRSNRFSKIQIVTNKYSQDTHPLSE